MKIIRGRRLLKQRTLSSRLSAMNVRKILPNISCLLKAHFLPCSDGDNNISNPVVKSVVQVADIFRLSSEWII